MKLIISLIIPFFLISCNDDKSEPAAASKTPGPDRTVGNLGNKKEITEQEAKDLIQANKSFLEDVRAGQSHQETSQITYNIPQNNLKCNLTETLNVTVLKTDANEVHYFESTVTKTNDQNCKNQEKNRDVVWVKTWKELLDLDFSNQGANMKFYSAEVDGVPHLQLEYKGKDQQSPEFESEATMIANLNRNILTSVISSSVKTKSTRSNTVVYSKQTSNKILADKNPNDFDISTLPVCRTKADGNESCTYAGGGNPQ